jgi:hypothetical protein
MSGTEENQDIPYINEFHPRIKSKTPTYHGWQRVSSADGKYFCEQEVMTKH